jgi:uncharacterized protein YhbP (UPF0306 family)
MSQKAARADRGTPPPRDSVPTTSEGRLSAMHESPAAPMPPTIRQALADHTTLTLAYADADGPGACAVLYAPTADAVPSLAFVTSVGTRHGRALQDQSSARVAFTAQRDGQVWHKLTGLQGRGTCRRLEGSDRRTVWAAYIARFPFVTADDSLAAAMESTALWELVPSWLRLIDNSQGFGHKEEWSASSPARNIGV